MTQYYEHINQSGLNKVKLYAIETIIENSDHIVYHNVKFAKRIVNNLITIVGTSLEKEEEKQLELATWLYTSVLGQVQSADKDPEVVRKEYASFIDEAFPSLLQKAQFEPKTIQTVIRVIKAGLKFEAGPDRLEGIFVDALLMDFTESNALDKLQKFYQETILSDLDLSVKKFYELAIQHLENYQPNTSYAKEHIKPKLAFLIQELETEKHKLNKKKSRLVQKQLKISDQELKELRKNLSSVKGRDSRGIQTLFRTTSNNHYTLNEMVDKKANIMITVNSIILSIVIGGILGQVHHDKIELVVPISIMALTALMSIIFAVLSITPNKTQGQFTEEEIRNKEGNLLYFGNFHKMEFRDYEWGMLEKLSDSDFLYSSMIKDIYYLGKTLHRKYNFIRWSLTIFLIGLILSFLASVILRLC